MSIALIVFIIGALLLIIVGYKVLFGGVKKSNPELINNNGAEATKPKQEKKAKPEKVYVEKKSWLCLFYFLALLLALYLALIAITFILSPFLTAINGGRLNIQTNVLPAPWSQNITVTEEKSEGFRARDEYGRTLKFWIIKPVESEIWFYDQDGNRKMDKVGIRSFYDRDTTKYVYFSKKQGEGEGVEIGLRYE